MFHDPERFGFCAALRTNWRTIRAEYETVAALAFDWPERELYGEGWKVYGLYDFPHGEKLASSERCPFTSALVERQIPAHGAAGFSVLRPRTRIQPHRGYPGQFLRCHLALKVPGEACGLKVEGETRRWREGEVLVFDDRVEHEAWNDNEEERVVLLVDFIP
jgi:ornithine lipid ester-linked acyl 2-hydroxylase